MPGLFDILINRAVGGRSAVADLLSRERQQQEAGTRVSNLQGAGAFGNSRLGTTRVSADTTTGAQSITTPVTGGAGLFGDAQTADAVQALLSSGDAQSTATGLGLTDRFASAGAPLTTAQTATLEQDESQFDRSLNLRRDLGVAGLLLQEQNQIMQAEKFSFDTAYALEKAQRDERDRFISNRNTFDTTLRGNAFLNKSAQALTAYKQLNDVLTNQNANFTTIGNAIVAVNQILEPGLAVRNDDVIRTERGVSSAFNRMAQIYNQWTSGEIDIGEMKMVLLEEGQRLMGPRAQQALESIEYYETVSRGVPGVGVGDVSGILGLGPDDRTLLNNLAHKNIAFDAR